MISGFSPLVEESGELSVDEMKRYSRHILIPDIGMSGQRRLKNARVAILGAGGLGSPAALYLAAAGVGTIGIIDFDTVELSNLQRQIAHSTADQGRLKVDSIADSIRGINPFVTIVRHNCQLTPENAIGILQDYDLIIDGADNFASRYLVSDAAAVVGVPHVWGSIYRFEGQVSVFWTANGIDYRDLFPEAPPPDLAPSCAEGGVLGVLCGTIASSMTMEAIKLITGVGQPLFGRLQVFDALTNRWDEFSVCAREAREPVAMLTDYAGFCGVGALTDDSSQLASVSVAELHQMLEARQAGRFDFDLVDVREPDEFAMVSINGSRLIPKSELLEGDLHQLSKTKPTVFVCKGGTRSAAVLAAVRRAGFSGARHVEGGVMAWVEMFEPHKVKY